MGEMLVNVSIILQDEGTATRDLSRHTPIGGLLPQEPLILPGRRGTFVDICKKRKLLASELLYSVAIFAYVLSASAIRRLKYTVHPVRPCSVSHSFLQGIYVLTTPVA